MKKLYHQNELVFSLCWIGIYVITLSAADSLSIELGIEKALTAPLCIILSLILFYGIKKAGLKQKYGLISSQIPADRLLYYVPLMLICSTNLWSGLSLNTTWLESLLYVISMICVGFLEEIIFRGFLFNALRKDGLKQAIAISSVTFGIGHIVNLFSGAELSSTLLQIGYAVSAGYLFTILYLHTGSLIPCIVSHSIINSLSCFSAERTFMTEVAAPVFLMVVPLLYAWYLNRKLK